MLDSQSMRPMLLAILSQCPDHLILEYLGTKKLPPQLIGTGDSKCCLALEDGYPRCHPDSPPKRRGAQCLTANRRSDHPVNVGRDRRSLLSKPRGFTISVRDSGGMFREGRGVCSHHFARDAGRTRLAVPGVCPYSSPSKSFVFRLSQLSECGWVVSRSLAVERCLDA